MSNKRFYKWHKLETVPCPVLRVFHGYVDGAILKAVGNLNSELTVGSIGFASAEAALELAKQAIDGGLNLTSDGYCLIELGNPRWLEPE